MFAVNSGRRHFSPSAAFRGRFAGDRRSKIDSWTRSPSPRPTHRLVRSPSRRGDRRCAWCTSVRSTSTCSRRWPGGIRTRGSSAGGDPGGVVGVLARYFDGDLTALDEVEVELHGTPFQQRVWLALRTVAAGTTTSYAELASRVGVAVSRARRGRRERREPRRRRPAVPPHHRQQRQPHRLRRRTGPEALAARPRGREAARSSGVRP